MIDELKRQLGGGARPSKYLLELSWGELDSQKLNVLCKAASLPEVKLTTVTAAYHGRKVVLRGETEFPETYDITVYDDQNLTLRKFFARWMLAIDDPGKYKTKLTDLAPARKGFLGQLISTVDEIKDQIKEEIADLKDLPGRIESTVSNWANGYFGIEDNAGGSMEFAAPLRIWLLDHTGAKVHGYELEDAYPISLGNIDLSAEKQNEIVEYSITFAFSGYIIIK